MPKAKKKKKKGTTYRRRRVSGLGKITPDNPIVPIASAVAGWFFADKINPGIDKLTGTMDQKIVSVAQTGIGAGLILVKMSNNKAVKWIQKVGGGVLAGAGLKRGLKEFGVLNGIGGYHSVPALSGYAAVPTIGGYVTNKGLNGALNGYTIPRPVHKQVMGSSGSGYNSQSGYMQ